MKKRFLNIINILYSAGGIITVLAIWQLSSSLGLMPAYMLPSPMKVAHAFINSFPELMQHAKISLTESFLGLLFGIILAFILAVIMDLFKPIYKMTYPLLIISQAVPVVAIAPLLVLWMGYGIAPKVALVMIVCFFPVAIGLLDGLRGVDPDEIDLLRAMGAKKMQIFRHIKLPGAMPAFFQGLKVSVSFSVVGAVIAEWLGGSGGLGVYMTRVRKSYSYDKMFAVIFLVIAISLALTFLTDILQRKMTPWKQIKK